MSALTDLVENLIAAQTPGSTPAFRKAALYEVTHDFCRTVLQTTPPTDSTTATDTWLTSAQWTEHHMTIIAGTLARLYAMPSKPWTNPGAAEIQAALYMAGTQRGREISAAATTNTGYDRIIANLRAAVPEMRDPNIHQELFNTVDDFRRNVLQLDPASHSASPTVWMTSAEYDAHFRVLLAGTLSRIYAQSKKPWSDPGAAAYQLAIYQQETATARSDKAASGATEPSDRLMSNVRSVIPGVKDPTLKQELFNAVDEACRKAFIWVEPVQVYMSLSRNYFKIPLDGVEIVRVVSITHEMIDSGFQYDNGKILYFGTLTEEIVRRPIYVTAAFTPAITVDLGDPDQWIPADLWGLCHELLLSGTLWRLFLQPNKSYTSEKLAQFYGQRNRRLLSEARQTIRSGGIIPPTSGFSYPRFAV